jgi:hypothetical protein
VKADLGARNSGLGARKSPVPGRARDNVPEVISVALGSRRALAGRDAAAARDAMPAAIKP